MQINKLSKCVTMVLLMCCYLSRKRVMQPRFLSCYQLAYQLMLGKVKHITKVAIYMRKVRMRYKCKLPSTTLVFLLRYQKALKVPPSTRWSPSQGITRKGQAPNRVTPWIAPGLPHTQVGLRCAFRQASPELLPAVFTIKVPAKTPQALFPPVHGDGHTINAVGVVSQDYKTLRCTTMVCASTKWYEVCNLTKH